MPGTTSRIRLAIAGGGTGGHVLPALSVLEILHRDNLIEDVFWIGSHDGHERQAATEAGIRYVAIPTGKLRRYLSIQNATDAARIPIGILAARRALRAARPDVLFSTGGFVSVPAVVAARGIAPVVTHEQTAILGLANRINARFAEVLAISHPRTETEAAKIHRRVAVTGNPVRVGLAQGSKARGLATLGFSDKMPVIYVTGGARGASALNQRIAALLPDVLEHVQILHQTGPASANADLEGLLAQRGSWDTSLQRRFVAVEFVGDELPNVYAAADIVIGRAGAGTVAELAYVGLPSILIPLPGAGGDEQAVNARVLADVGAAVVLPQAEATPERLWSELLGILADPERMALMRNAATSVSQPNAASKLAKILVAVGQGQSTFRDRKR